jgi:uncharacterized protein
MRRWTIVVATLALLATAIAPVVASAAPVTTWGYITTSDGARLRYTAVLPDTDDKHPVALIWSVYTDGVGPTGGYPPAESPVIADALLEAGYVILGVNMRGTGCSGGSWDLFQPASDGYEVVEWAAAQPWSTGDVGMFGFSAPGISQLLTAATHPPHLRAITPADVSTDFYRDVANPGGISNITFTGFWTLGSLTSHQALSIPYAAEHGDPDCAAEIAGREQPNNGKDFLMFTQHPYDDATWDHYSPERILEDINVPLLTCQAMQDDQVSSRAGGYWLDHVDPTTSWTVFTNGNHGTCDDYQTPYTDLVVRFFDHYVRGVANGFGSEPHVQVWHETRHDDEARANVPGWVASYPSWPVAVEPRSFHLTPAGALSALPAPAIAASSYAYPLPSSPMESNEYAPSNGGWKIPNAAGGSLEYTSPALTEDLGVFGPGSVDLWLSSTASDTDVQVTLSEVRPDGQEVYVQRGWLRASHRALDDARSTELRPYHSHAQSDAAPLVAGEPALLRVELNALWYTFRAGSRLRLHIEAPTGITGLFGFDYIKTPGVNTVWYGGAHTSRFVLGTVPGSAPVGYPECDTLISHPCR